MRNLIAVAVSLALAPLALAEPPTDIIEMKATSPRKAKGSKVIKVTGTITALDRAARTVTVKGKAGREETFHVGPELKRFDELAVGEAVAMEFQQGLALEFQPPGQKSVEPEVITGRERSDQADAAGSASATWVRATVTVTAIDLKDRLVVFQGPQGLHHQVEAGPKIQLEKLKVGDRLLATYYQSLAITLEKALAKPPM